MKFFAAMKTSRAAPRHAVAVVGLAATAAFLLGGGVLWAQSPPPRVAGTHNGGTPVAAPPPGQAPSKNIGNPVPGNLAGVPTRPPGPYKPTPGVGPEYRESPAMAARAAENRAKAQPSVPESVATRGQRVILGGKPVQLPADAYLDGSPTALAQDASGKWISLHTTTVRRGNSRAGVDDLTGKITRIDVDPNRPGEMDFLVEALK